ncbi:MAG: ribonuclease PH [Candidatus Aureabacteria bacterium]|nr:ribonuclease PH [Candidatus Auribacterota bacterium]
MRSDGRKKDELREIRITKGFIRHNPSSVLIEFGNTRVICSATVEDDVPRWLKEQSAGGGWVTAEYSMLPASTPSRTQRESSRGKIGGRTHEIQRLIGRALRSVIDLEKLGRKTVWIDCDVIEADGGTRTASITGAFIALSLSIDRMLEEKRLKADPVKDYIAAVSVGIVESEVLVDLSYQEDFSADVDMNVVMTGKGKFVEVQGSGEESVFSKEQLDEMLLLASQSIKKIILKQKSVLKN